MSTILSGNRIWHATINFIRSRTFLQVVVLKSATPDSFPTEEAEARKLSSTIDWKYLPLSINKYNASLKSSLIFREPPLKLKYCRILITIKDISKIELVTNKGVNTLRKWVYANLVKQYWMSNLARFSITCNWNLLSRQESTKC